MSRPKAVFKSQKKRSLNIQDCRLNNVGVLINQAANVGVEDLENVFNTVPSSEVSKGVNFADKRGITPLVLAVRRGCLSSVKLLLYHGADINYSLKHALHSEKIWTIAKKAGHLHIEQYLKKCCADLKSISKTRAELEITVKYIAMTPNCSNSDQNHFEDCLKVLIQQCGYAIDGVREHENDTQPLLIRAGASDNIPIVLKLIQNFNANVENHEMLTAQTIMHIACENLSKLRFYLVKHFPQLLTKRDVTGKLPLHISCAKNDIQFISWIFGKILALEDDEVSDSIIGISSLPRTRSLSDVLSPSATLPPNKSFQCIFSKPRPDYAAKYFSKNQVRGLSPQLSLEEDNGVEGLDSDENNESFSRPLSFCIERSLSASYSGSSRSGSSESSVVVSPRRVFQSFKFKTKGKEHSEEVEDKITTAPPIPPKNNEIPPLLPPRNSDIAPPIPPKNKAIEDAIMPITLATSGSDSSFSFNAGIGVLKGPRTFSFMGCSEEEFVESHKSLHAYQVLVNKLLDLENLIALHPLTRPEIVSIKPFSVDEEGDTIFHILARSDHYDSLSVIVRVANFLKQQVNLEMLVNREGFNSRLPIEEALHVRSHRCVYKLIRLSMAAGLMPQLLQDPHVLKGAVFVNDIKLVRMLIENGFHQGIKPAISLAILSEYHDLLRILLFWQTQVMNSMEYARLKKLKGQRMLSLDHGTIKWCEIQLENIDVQWLYDATCATNSVSQCLRFFPISHDITEKNFEYFKALGVECLQYFDSVVGYLGLTATLPAPLAPITEINISENQLGSVPMELFQMPSLKVLRLSHNALTELPVSKNLSANFYKSKLVKIDLDWNHIQELPDDLFCGVASSLVELSVQYNKLEKLPPGLWVMPKLKKIKLAHNKLKKLHVLSHPSYFVDFDTSKNIKLMFDTNSNGELVCAGDENAAEMKQLVEYLHRLAKFYLTVFAAKGISDINFDCVWRDVIDLHIARYHSLQNSDETIPASLEGSPQILQLLEGDEDWDSFNKSIVDLELLDLSYNQFNTFPWDLACIAPNLQKLDLRGNSIINFDIVHSVPRKTLSIVLVQNKLVSLNLERLKSLPCGNVVRLLSAEDLITDSYCQHCNHSFLECLSNLMLDQNELSYFPILETPHTVTSDGSFDLDTFYPELSILSLAKNKFTAVPKNLHHLVHLSSLDLSHNEIVELPLDMGLMNISNLLLLKLDGMYIRNIPEGLLEKPKQLLYHLKALKQKSQPYRRMKLMVVGGANIGKTSLLIQLVKRGKMKRFTELEKDVNDRPLSTVGVELGDWEYWQSNKPKVTFMTWDFGGQEEYYATHQCFLTRRSLYLLLWNITEGVDGLIGLRPWLENIEGRAPKSPVIVVGTHLDKVPPVDRVSLMATLQAEFEELYLRNTHRKYTYPRIHEQCQFISVNSTRNIDYVRDYIYEFALQYKVPVGPHAKNAMPLLNEAIPQSYLVLQDIVQETAQRYEQQKKRPILTKKEFLHVIRNSRQKIDEHDLEQATSFLHDSGILLHFEDSSLLNNLYFISPQWLCSMLAKLIAIKEFNPYQRNGFMLMKDVFKIYNEICEEFLIFMQKFEVVLKLDDNRLLIPSLLPNDEEDSCVVFSQAITKKLLELTNFEQPTDMPHVHIYEIPHPIISRFYLLPFVPSGFFSRVMARLMSSEIIDILNQCLLNNQLGIGHVVNSTHWKCWRNGIIITWNHFEIFRIGPLCNNLPGASTVGIVTRKEKCEHLKQLKGIEIKVAILPEEYIVNFSILEGKLSNTTCSETKEVDIGTGKSLASWLLHQATTKVESVFEDWYESFAKKKGFDPQEENVRILNPCTLCMKEVEKERLRLLNIGVATTDSPLNPVCYMFSSAHVAHASTSEEILVCPRHGTQNVSDVAPDMVFSDFLNGKIFSNPSSITIREQLGDGGFGTVYRATLHTRGTVENVAAKRFIPDNTTCIDDNPEVVAQLKAWDIYQKASVEARVMHQLSHPNILGLIGISLRPLTLLVELAPEGDLKRCVERFKRSKIRLSRKTLQATLIQVAEALNYLHSRQFIYRDLKPENILVWSFPLPETQWCFEHPIYVKVADYGISKEITPQGIRGVEGTRPYLPPEVILHGGREAYSNKVDVYAFGMLIYFLLSYRSPFDSGRPISALLEENKRPELPAKMYPCCIQVLELMCWCWSELPNYRPDFSTVINVLKTDMFTRLLQSFQLTENEEQVTTSCIRYVQPRMLSSTSSSPDSSSSFVFSSNVSRNSNSTSEDSGIQVWYGTDAGKYGIVQFQNSGINKHEKFELAPKKYVSCICFIKGNIWIGTIGQGMTVINPNTRDIITQWGILEHSQIYHILNIPDKNMVLILSHKGLFLSRSDASEIYATLNPLSELKEISVGAVISFEMCANISEVWVTSQQAKLLYIIETENFEIEGKIPFVSGDVGANVVRHMTTVEISSKKVYLALASKHIIYIMDVKERKQTEYYFNCQEICAKGIEDIGVRADRVTALVANDQFLYAGTRRGVVICFNCATIQPTALLDAYKKPCRSLLLMNTYGQQSKPFQRLFSRGVFGMRLLSSSSDSNSSIYESYRSARSSQYRKLSVSSSSNYIISDEESHSSLLASFGNEYRGVVGESIHFPEKFMLPSENAKTSTQLAIPSHTAGFLLLWSKECEKRDVKYQDSDILAIDEESLPDNTAQGYSD